jgi:hypothetical protein
LTTIPLEKWERSRDLPSCGSEYRNTSTGAEMLASF